MCSYKIIKTLSSVVENRIYTYRIIKSQFISHQGDIIQAYGIITEKIDSTNHDTINIESSMIKYISPYLHKVSNLLALLHSNRVSPIHLVDVIGEYVDEYTTDFDIFIMDKVSTTVTF